jgi:hypothetical protein
MTRWIGVAIPLLALMLDGSIAIDPATAAPLQARMEMQKTRTATDLSGRRRARHHARSADRAHDRSYYYDRPLHYMPAPFVPFNYGYVFWPWR